MLRFELLLAVDGALLQRLGDLLLQLLLRRLRLGLLLRARDLLGAQLALQIAKLRLQIVGAVFRRRLCASSRARPSTPSPPA
jgi:hypothetical protein